MRAEFFQSAPLLLLLLATTSECLSEHRLEGRKVGGRGIVGTRRFSTVRVGQIECKQRARELRADLTLAENNRDRIRFRFVVGLTASAPARREGKTERERERAKERRSSRDRDRERSSIPVAVGRSLRRVADRSSSNILICRRRNDIREREGERDCLFEELSRFRLSNKSGFQFLEHI